MRKCVFSFLAAGLLFGNSLYIDSSSGIHSAYLRDGQLLSRSLSVTQLFYFDLPQQGIWFDASGFSELRDESRYYGEYSAGAGKALSEHLFISAVLGIYSPQLQKAEPELQLQLSGTGRLPLQLRLKYNPVQDWLYGSVDTYLEYDLMLPVYLSMKAGALQQRTGITADAELALSAYMSIGPYMIEPFISIYRIGQGRQTGSVLNLSLSRALAVLSKEL